MIRLALALLLAGCATDDGGPRIASIAPTVAGPGADIALVGTRLCSGACATTGGEILIGLDPPQTRAIVKTLAVDGATFQIPSGTPSGKTVVIVEVGDRASNAIELTVLAP